MNRNEAYMALVRLQGKPRSEAFAVVWRAVINGLFDALETGTTVAFSPYLREPIQSARLYSLARYFVSALGLPTNLIEENSSKATWVKSHLHMPPANA